MESFTPWSALAGGMLIGLSAALLLWTTGRIAGISGIARGLLSNGAAEFVWRALFLAGLVAGAWLYYAFAGSAAQATVVPHARPGFPPLLLVVAGLAVGYGTALAMFYLVLIIVFLTVLLRVTRHWTRSVND